MDDKDARIVALEEELARVKDALRQANSVRDVFAQAVVQTASGEFEELAEWKKDAARYRWLKINARRIDFAGLCVSDGAQLDARIDAAMSKD